MESEVPDDCLRATTGAAGRALRRAALRASPGATCETAASSAFGATVRAPRPATVRGIGTATDKTPGGIAWAAACRIAGGTPREVAIPASREATRQTTSRAIRRTVLETAQGVEVQVVRFAPKTTMYKEIDRRTEPPSCIHLRLQEPNELDSDNQPDSARHLHLVRYLRT